MGGPTASRWWDGSERGARGGVFSYGYSRMAVWFAQGWLAPSCRAEGTAERVVPVLLRRGSTCPGWW